MDGWNLPWDGGCRCGRVRLRVSAPPLVTSACHCAGCQRMSASAFSLSIAVPSPGFAVTQGEPVIGGLHGDAHHFFYPWCMSWMFTRPDDAPWLVNVRAVMLDDPRAFPPFMETFMNEKLAWVTTPAVHRFAQFPALEDYPGLLAEFQASRAAS